MGKWNRRDFLKTTCCSAAAGFAAASFSRFGLVNALAQNATDYKALVCVFLFGGNDSNNMVIPYDTAGYGATKRHVADLPWRRDRCCLSIPQASDRLSHFTPLWRDAVAIQ